MCEGKRVSNGGRLVGIVSGVLLTVWATSCAGEETPADEASSPTAEQVRQSRHPPLDLQPNFPGPRAAQSDRLRVIDVVRMVKAGVAEKVVLRHVVKQHLDAKLTVNDLIFLTKQNVSTQVITRLQSLPVAPAGRAMSSRARQLRPASHFANSEGAPAEPTRPILVRRGEDIEVVAQMRGIRLRERVRATSDGALGELITVQGMGEGRREFQVRVVGERRTEVPLGPQSQQVRQQD